MISPFESVGLRFKRWAGRFGLRMALWSYGVSWPASGEPEVRGSPTDFDLDMLGTRHLPRAVRDSSGEMDEIGGRLLRRIHQVNRGLPTPLEMANRLREIRAGLPTALEMAENFRRNLGP